jgi:hypothetical protein
VVPVERYALNTEHECFEANPEHLQSDRLCRFHIEACRIRERETQIARGIAIGQQVLARGVLSADVAELVTNLRGQLLTAQNGRSLK